MCTRVSTIFPILPCSSDVYLLQHSIITWPFSQTEVCLPIVSSLSPSTMHSNYCDLFIFLTDLIPLLMSLKSHKWFTTIYTCLQKWWISGTMFKLYKWTSSLPHPPTHPSMTAQLMISFTKFTVFHIQCLRHWEWLQSIKAWFHTQDHDLSHTSWGSLVSKQRHLDHHPATSSAAFIHSFQLVALQLFWAILLSVL
jgi:hypothetical protein